MSRPLQPDNNPNVGPEPVEAEPNRGREKTYKDPTPPRADEREFERLPENTAKDKVREDMSEATAAIKSRV